MRTSVREVFAVAAATYGRGNPLRAVERPETAALLPVLSGRAVLDAGAGHGHYAALARASGARVAVALDLTPEMLRAAGPGLRVIADAGRLPVTSASIDVVVEALVLSHLADPGEAIREAARVLRPGGAFVFSDLHPVASRLGWRRVFDTGRGATVEATAPPLAGADIRHLLAAAGLSVDLWREPVVDERLAPHFAAAGRRDFEALRGTPLLVVARARKRGTHAG
jgi:ubiquinone/menaquinone biosynthesis C-methylase UbiE